MTTTEVQEAFAAGWEADLLPELRRYIPVGRDDVMAKVRQTMEQMAVGFAIGWKLGYQAHTEGREKPELEESDLRELVARMARTLSESAEA